MCPQCGNDPGKRRGAVGNEEGPGGEPEDEEDPIVSRHLTLVRDSGSGYSVFVSVVGPDTNFRWDKSGGSGAHENYELTRTMTDSGPLEIIHRQGNGGSNSSSENSSAGNGSASMNEYYDLTWINGVLQNPTGYMRTEGGTSSTSSFPGGFQSQFNSTPGGFGSYTDDIFDMLLNYADGGGAIAPAGNNNWFRAGWHCQRTLENGCHAHVASSSMGMQASTGVPSES